MPHVYGIVNVLGCRVVLFKIASFSSDIAREQNKLEVYVLFLRNGDHNLEAFDEAYCYAVVRLSQRFSISENNTLQ